MLVFRGVVLFFRGEEWPFIHDRPSIPPGPALGRIHLANDEETLLPQFGSIKPAGFAGDYCSEPPPVGTNKNNTVRNPNHPQKMDKSVRKIIGG